MLGVVQLCSKRNPITNFQDICKPLIIEATKKGCQLICLPEAFDFIGIPGAGDGAKNASYLDGDLMTKYCSVAKENNVWLSLGGFHEKLRENEISETQSRTMANAHVIVNSKGEIVANYRKVHMFDAAVDGGYVESSTVKPGEELVAVDTPIGRVGLTVCFDLRFPQIFSRLAKAGCDVILVPSAFMPTTGKAHWHTLLRSRAIENQIYIAAAAQVGAHNEKRSSFGHSLIVDPWGKVLCDLGEEEAVIGVQCIDKSTVADARRLVPTVGPDISTFPLKVL